MNDTGSNVGGISEDENSMIIQQVDKYELMKESMLAHIHDLTTTCVPLGGTCDFDRSCCSGHCIWNTDPHTCQESCLPDGTRGCAFNSDCCSNYCEWFISEDFLCH